MFTLCPCPAGGNCSIDVFFNFCPHVLSEPILQLSSLKGQGTGTAQVEFLGVFHGIEKSSAGYRQGETWNNSAVM